MRWPLACQREWAEFLFTGGIGIVSIFISYNVYNMLLLLLLLIRTISCGLVCLVVWFVVRSGWVSTFVSHLSGYQFCFHMLLIIEITKHTNTQTSTEPYPIIMFIFLKKSIFIHNATTCRNENNDSDHKSHYLSSFVVQLIPLPVVPMRSFVRSLAPSYTYIKENKCQR